MRHFRFSSLIYGLALSPLICLPVVAAECTASSGPNRVALLELYTSEGCSSCPPADRWLSSVTANPDRVVPLALHVDYWDYIGWKDRFAKTAFSARQREMAGFSRSGFVYTPQMMLNGQDFRSGYSNSRFEEQLKTINRTAPQAKIKLSVNQTADSVELSTTGQAARQSNPVLYVALYENELTSEVKAGENNGARLHHDYVVREWLGPYPIDDNSTTPWQQKIDLKPDWKTKNMGAAAFVQNHSTGEVLQAVALKFCS